MPLYFRSLFRMAALIVCFIALIPADSNAYKAKDGKDSWDQLAFSKDGTWLTLNSQNLTAMFTEVSPAMIQDFDAFQASTGNTWLILVDRITGKPSLIEGGVPWIPGTGWNNAIKASDIGVMEETAAANQIPVDLVVEKAMTLLKTYPNLFNIDPADLQLMDGASGPMLDYLYNLNFQWTYHGLPVEHAYMGFYLNSGNLVMFGATNMCDTIKSLDPNPSIKLEDAWKRLWTYLNDKPSTDDKIIEPGRLLVQPMSVSAVVSSMPHALGQGLEYRLVYVLSFSREGIMGTWEARIDAHTGEIISFMDEDKYGHIQGGVYKTDANPNQTEVSVPFPYADYAASSFADIAGNYTGTSGTSTMNGRTGTSTTVGSVEIYDYCGAISKASDGTGLIDFGSSTGTNCTTPGSGGAGNTHSSRTQYWNVNQLKIKAYTYLVGNNWLEGTFVDEVNYNSYGNARWVGGATGYAQFFRSGGGYGNTGELPGVSLHEVGHGLDYNDGNGFSPEGGTGEIYGDTTAMLQTHESCAGGGFTSGNCSGYGHTCTSCTGVRDADYAKHKPAEMATPTGFCYDHCPTGYACKGPCLGECHCENAPGAQANWDLAVRVFPTLYGMDVATAWQYLDKYWYASAPNRAAAFVCGVNTSAATGNLFYQYRFVDDCDGNLSNGTPHAAGIWQALGTNHQIGNSSAVNTDNNCGCTSLSTPVLSGVAGNGQVTLSWSAITGASSYDVYRNETSCTSGYTKAGNTALLTFTDSPLSNGATYYYKIQAKGTGSCPPSAMSNCVTLTPVSGGCTAPGAPTLNSATGTCSGVDLAWTAGSGTTLSYNVYRKASPCGGTYTKIDGPVTGTTYTDTTAAAGTTYAYVIKGACDAGGATESAYSNCLTAAPLALPAIPAAPTLTDDCAGLIVSWTAVPSATSYSVRRGTRANCASQSEIGTSTTTSYTDGTAAIGSTYYYSIVAINACGSSAASTCTGGTHNTAGAPSAPTGLTATGVCASVNLSWTASTGATSYNVLRTTNSNCSTGLAQIGTSATTTYNDTSAVAGTTYYYVVQAVSTCGTSANSTCANAARLQTPAAPTGLTATGSCTAVDLSWTASTGATSYEVWRTTNANCTTGAASIATPTGATYSDTTAVAGTTYYYTVKAINACGTSAISNCANAARTSAPAAPTGLTATGVCTGINLSWTASSGATSYEVWRGTNANCTTGAASIGTSAVTTYSDTTAVAGTTYYYTVKAVNACGTSGISNCANSVRLATPTAPAGPTYTAVSCTTLTVNWVAVSGATAYDVYRRTGACGTGAVIAADLAGTTYNDTGLSASTQYSYYIVAKNTCGSSATGACTSTTTTGAPTAPTGLTATGSCTAVDLSWASVSGATSYEVWRSANANCTTGAASIGTSATTAYSDTTAVAGTTYYYTVKAVNACGTSAVSNCANAARLATPAAPTGLTATGSCTAVDLSWTTSSGATSYEVWRTTNANCTTGAASIATPTGATYSDTTAVAGTTYYYTIKAVNACGTSAVSNCANAARLAAPAAPTGLAATGACTGINLSWTVSSGATSYEIWRTTNANCTTGAASIGTSAVTTYSDTTAAAGTTYYYTVKAVNSCGTSAVSNCANAVRLATPAAPAGPTYTSVSCTTLTVNWGAVSGATTYDVYRRTGACGAGSIIAADLAGTTYNDTGLSASTQYSYYLVVKNTCGSSAAGACTSTTTTGTPSAPADLTATGACAGVDLAWTAASGATSYEIWRTTNGNCTSAVSNIGTSAATTYSDTTAVVGTTYYYTVKAVNACGTSVISNCANAARLSLPGAPSITGITDNNACAQDGIRVAYTDGSGATSHDLYRDGALVATGYVSNALHNPGNSTAHIYLVRAVNACATADSGTQSFTDADNSTTPTITGANSNTCPSTTVALSTQSGMTGYQWYLGGSPIGGATSSTYPVSASGTYTVQYTNGSGCTSTSAGHAVTITPCIPNIIYQSNLAPVEVVGGGDGDGVMEAGEKWQIQVTVFNNGQADATAVLGSLAGEGLTYCNNPGAFGSVAMNGTASFTFTFVLDTSWYTSYSCGASIGFDLVSKSSNGGTYTYASDMNFDTQQVGVPGGTSTENATAPNISNAKNAAKTSAFAPAFTLTPTITSATAAFTLSGHPNPTSCVWVELVAPDAVATTLKAYGTAAQASYDVTTFYNAHGAGAYVLRVSELAGCGGASDAADATGITMAVQSALPGNCDIGTATCANVAPEVSDDGLHRLSVSKNADPAFVDLMFEDVAASAYSLYVSNQANTHPFQVNDNLVGVHTCTLSSSPAAGGMRLASGVDLESGFHAAADTTVLYYLVTANNGAGTEGSLGSDSIPSARTADSYCAK